MPPKRTATDMKKWSPGSWRAAAVCEQMATYDDQKEAYDATIAKLSKVPPLVSISECERLVSLLAECGRGERFIVQGGDCAERFIDCEPGRVGAQLEVLVQMGAVVQAASKRPALILARLAGQYGKPRSKPFEMVEGIGELHSFKGDNINGYDTANRKWNPQRLLDGYWHGAATLNYLRTLRADGEDLLSGVDLSFMGSSALAAEAAAAEKAIKGSAATQASAASEFFTSHEGMQLDLEEAMTRLDAKSGKHYNLSAHFIWIGDRTRQLNGGHVEYFRGVANPVGCKVGPSMKPDELKELVAILNPDKIAGKLVLITRYGASKVASMLPAHIAAVKESGVPVVWECDGVHGNTVSATAAAAKGLKTRNLDDVVAECLTALKVHAEAGTVLGGVHLELSGKKEVTECVGGCSGVTEDDLPRCYETYCDPRLNQLQALEAAVRVAKELK